MGIHKNNNIDENFTSFTFKKEINTASKEDKNTKQEQIQTDDTIHTLVQVSSNGLLSTENNTLLDNKLNKIEQTLDILLKKLDNPVPTHSKNDELLLAMATKINQLEITLEHIQKSIYQQKEQNHQENETQDEIMNALRTNNLFLSKIDQKIDQMQKIKLQEYQNNAEELLNTTQAYNLFLAKVEKKLDVLYKMQQNAPKNESQEQVEKHIQTNNLFLSKIEQKIELLSKAQTQNNSNEILNEILETSKTNALYVAKSTQKIELLSKAQTQNNSNEILNEILETSKTNALYVAKSTQKIELFERLINHLKQTLTPTAKNDEELKEIYAKLEANAYLMSKLEQKIDLVHKNYQEQKTTWQNIENVLFHKDENQTSNEQLWNDFSNQLQSNILSEIQKENQTIQQEQIALKEAFTKELQNIQTHLSQDNYFPEVNISALIQKEIEENNQKMKENFEVMKSQILEWIKSYGMAFTDIITTFKTEVEKLFVQTATNSTKDDKTVTLLAQIKENLLSITQNKNNFDDFVDLLQNIKEEIIKKIHFSTPDLSEKITKKLESLEQNITLMGTQIQKDVELKGILDSLESQIKHIGTNIAQQAIEKNTNIWVDIPAKEFWNDLKTILENNHKQLAQIEQNFSNFAKEKEQINPQNLLNGIYTNNLYLSKMEQKFENLLNKINNQQKTF